MDANGITLRRFLPSDAAACQSLILQCIGDMTGVEMGAYEKLRDRVRTADYLQQLSPMHCLVACVSDEVVGMGALDGNVIKRMYVASSYRRRNVGRAIYEALEQHAKRNGIKELELEASMNAVGFYGRLGFIEVSEKTWKIEGFAVHNVIMMKKI